MTHQKNETNHSLKLLQAGKIVLSTILVQPPKETLDHLREMMECFFMFHDDITPEYKQEVYFSYKLLSDSLNQLVDV